ncbi:hypothetical protein [Solitalea longa]|uniref:hypothetical protein n=1 Tax=Solitalea longa TaxID=2079460 RepID=UPI0013FE092B|nr:hypothetical protein [Solitalea longa]
MANSGLAVRLEGELDAVPSGIFGPADRGGEKLPKPSAIKITVKIDRYKNGD